jgi:undecaprenyl diphosphate synthase
VTEACAELGVSYLTLYAFSTENWNRPLDEVNGLMKLLGQTIRSEVATLKKNNIRLNFIGALEQLPNDMLRMIQGAMNDTKDCTGMVLNIALSYSGRWDLTEAVRKIAVEAKEGRMLPEAITQATVGDYLATAGMPDPELLIRTSGELRISNFLLWQLAYAEFYFTNKYWPDFRKDDLFEAVLDFQHRERRFGKTSEQVKK